MRMNFIFLPANASHCQSRFGVARRPVCSENQGCGAGSRIGFTRRRRQRRPSPGQPQFKIAVLGHPTKVTVGGQGDIITFSIEYEIS
jgi:hypothetical protein